MHARSALFDVYGDHLRARSNQAPVAALVRLLDPIGIQAPAVRTAISRMVLQGWLEPVQLDAGRGYRATAQAIRRLDAAAARIYGTRPEKTRWDGSWQLVLLGRIDPRAHRQRARDALGFLGYAELADGTWISPYPREELEDLLRRDQIDAATAVVRDFDPPERPLEAWDLAELAKEYDAWLAEAEALVDAQRENGDDPDEAAFAVRFQLVHEWRKFLFRDPGLPAELLPDDWAGRRAAAYFTTEARRLKPGADRYVDRCLTQS